MSSNFQFCCRDMEQNIKETHVIAYNKVFDEYGLHIMEDKVSNILMNYCPWCGKKLPNSQREEWFKQLEKLGFENPLFNESIPGKYRCEKWRME